MGPAGTARVVYVDHDPVVVAHARALLATAVLHVVPEDARAARGLAAWREVMVPGSHVVVSHVAPGQGEQAPVIASGDGMGTES